VADNMILFTDAIAAMHVARGGALPFAMAHRSYGRCSSSSVLPWQ
jgi:hypothetical protein